MGRYALVIVNPGEHWMHQINQAAKIYIGIGYVSASLEAMQIERLYYLKNL